MSVIFALQDRLRRKFNNELARSLLGFVNPHPSDKLLDIGGGTGFLAELLSDYFSEAWVLEPDSRKINFAVRKRKKAKFLLGTAEHIAFPDGYFRAVHAIGSFHHIHDQELALEEIRRVTSEAGKLAILEFNPETSCGKLARFLENLRREKLQFHEPSRLKEMIQQHGFVEISTAPFFRGYLLTGTRQANR